MKALFGFGTRAAPIPSIAGENWEETRPDWKQVHQVKIVEVVSLAQQCGQVDALWTRKSNLPVAVITADCVPILLSHRSAHGFDAVAAVHAGWRGLEQQIVPAFFQQVPLEFSNPADWEARIGPCIHADCYEVSEELIEQFVRLYPNLPRPQIEPAHRKLDLVRIALHQLEDAGVKQVEIDTACTFCSREAESEAHRYFSYRRGDRNSRQYSVASLVADSAI